MSYDSSIYVQISPRIYHLGTLPLQEILMHVSYFLIQFQDKISVMFLRGKCWPLLPLCKKLPRESLLKILYLKGYQCFSDKVLVTINKLPNKIAN